MGIRAIDIGLITNALNGVPQLLGSIVATTTKNNHDTATPFNDTGAALTGKTLLLQASAACYVYFGTLNTTTATTSHMYLDANEKWECRMTDSVGFIACVSVSGTTTLKIFEMF